MRSRTRSSGSSDLTCSRRPLNHTAADGRPLVVVDPAKEVDAAQVEVLIHVRPDTDPVWWLELHSPAAAGQQGARLAGLLATFLTAHHGGTVPDLSP